MRLDQLLDDDESGWTATRLASEVRRFLPRGARKTTPSTISRLRRKGDRAQTRTASVELALAIERATDGVVTAEEVPLSTEARRMLRFVRSQQQAAPSEDDDRDGDGPGA